MRTAATITARDAAALTALVRKLQVLKTRADAQLVSAGKALAAADQAKVRAEDLRQKAAATAADIGTQLDAANAAATATGDTTGAIDGGANTEDDAKQAAATPAPDAAALAESTRKVGLLKTRADAELALADQALAGAEQADARAHDQQQAAATKAADLARQLDTAMADAKAKVAEAAAAKDAIKPAQSEKAAAAKAASEAQLLLEPVSIYISRATQKIYVRRNTHKPAPDGGGEVFDTSIEAPITIRDPEKPIGTHVFTAVASSDAGLRWTAVTIDGADDVRDALDRITIPQDVLDRIAPTALPRSSIVVSDEPLSAETNYRTEFVAVLNNYPEGGFITRRPSTDVVASQKDDGFDLFSFFRGN
jgi:hypothetical protein